MAGLGEASRIRDMWQHSYIARWHIRQSCFQMGETTLSPKAIAGLSLSLDDQALPIFFFLLSPLPSPRPSEVRDVGPRDDSSYRLSRRVSHERRGTLAIGTSRWQGIGVGAGPGAYSRSAGQSQWQLAVSIEPSPFGFWGTARAGWGCCIARWSDRRPATSAPCNPRVCVRPRWLAGWAAGASQQLRQPNCRKAAGQGTPRATMDQGPRPTRPQFCGRSQMQP